MKTYISGLISNGGTLLDEDIARNINSFSVAEKTVLGLGLIPLNPCKIVQRSVTWQDYMRKDLEKLICECDSIYMLRNWHISRGAQLEFHLAISLGYKVYFQ